MEGKFSFIRSGSLMIISALNSVFGFMLPEETRFVVLNLLYTHFLPFPCSPKRCEKQYGKNDRS